METIARHGGFQHEALVYDGADEYLAGTVPFLRAGMQAGEPALVAVGPEQTRLLEAELGFDCETVEFVDMRELGSNPAWIISFWREFVDRAGGRSVRGIGEPVWAARSPAALEECHRHEALLNVAFAPEPSWSLLCPYDAGALPEQALEQVASSHPRLSGEDPTRPNPQFDPEPDCFAGELPRPRVEVYAFAFGLSNLVEVRSLVASTAERAGMEEAAVADLVTAASELAANSIVHGGGEGVLRLWSEDDCVLAEVEDRGRIEEPLVGRLRPNLEQEGGRGLWLANQLCDLVQIRSREGRTVVRLHLGAREFACV
ncbi:MAG TPA: sensor histidine kinase [Solirubrobacterales bacterium]|nr:sensor histidine kinase [Solirubrobacterales bacterium]